MVSQTSFHLPLLVFSIFIHLLLVTAKDGGVSDLIRKSCNGTEYPETCISVFESDSRSQAATNKTGLCSVGLNITYEKTNEALSFFIKAQKNATGRYTKSGISVCIRDYEFGLLKMNERGFPGFERGDYDDAGWGVGYCNYAASDCLDTSLKFYVQENRLLYNFSLDVMHMLNSLIP